MHSVNWPPLNAAYTPTVSVDPPKPRIVLRVKPRTIYVRGPIEAIAAEGAERAGITLAQILGAQRSQKYVRPRHIAMWRAARETRNSLSEIARVYDRDHTAVLHAIRKVDAAMSEPSPQPSPVEGTGEGEECSAGPLSSLIEGTGEGEPGTAPSPQCLFPLPEGEGRVRERCE